MSKSKLLMTILFSFLSLGVVLIIAKINVKFYILILCVKCQIKDSDYILVIDKDNNYNLCYTKRESFLDNTNSEEINKSVYMGLEINNKSNTHIVFFYFIRLWNIVITVIFIMKTKWLLSLFLLI